MTAWQWPRPELLPSRSARAVDPMCGELVDVWHAVRREFDGCTRLFCSKACAVAFEGNPGAYDVPNRPPFTPR